MMKRMSFQPIVACLIALAFFIAYLPAVPAAVLTGDSGEFQFAVPLVGIVHPTGYPLYMLAGKLWTLLLPFSPAYAMNLFSTFWAALALAFFWAALRPWLGTLPALAGTVLLGTMSLFHEQALVAEVYALNSFLICLTIFAVSMLVKQCRCKMLETEIEYAGDAVDKRDPANSRLLLLAGAFGLGLAHHRTILFLVPAVALTLWLTRRAFGSFNLSRRSLGYAALLLLVPLLLYLYIPLRGSAVPYLMPVLPDGTRLTLYDNSITSFLAQISGSRFGSQLALDQALSPAFLGGRLSLYLAALLDQFFPSTPGGYPALIIRVLGIGLAILGAGATLVQARLRPVGIGLVVAWLCYTAFTLVYTIGDIADFYTPSFIIVAIWFGAGVAAISSLIPARTPALRHVPAFAALLVLLVLFSFSTPAAPAQAVQAAEAIIAGTENAQIANDAVLISNDRDDMTPLYYRQYILGWRPDVTLLYPGILPDKPWNAFPTLLEKALASGQSTGVYLVKPMPGLGWRFNLQPVNDRIQRVQPLQTQQPYYPAQTTLGNVVEFSGYDYDAASRVITLHWKTLAALTQAYDSFTVLTRDGQPQMEQQTEEVGSIYDPANEWSPQTPLKSSYTLSPTLLAGRYRLETGWFDAASKQPLPVTGADGKPAGERLVLPFDLRAAPGTTGRSLPPGLEYTEKQANLGTQIQLHGYTLISDTQNLKLTLIWGASGTPQHDYTIFVQILDGSGKVIEQKDAQPENGFYPTSLWTSGDMLAESYTFKRPPDGTYRLICGMYDPADGEKRLPVNGNGDFIDLLTIHLGGT